MLESKPKHGIEDFEEMQRDVKSKKAEQFTPVFIDAIVSESELSKTESDALKTLQGWDYQLNSESAAASVFEILYRKVCENLIKDDLSPELFTSVMGQRIIN